MPTRRPGLAKVRAIPLSAMRRVVLVRMAPHRASELLDAADVISEGSEVEGKRGRRTYYGSSSFIIALELTGETGDEDVLAAVVGDLHLRLLALRRARLEASARASAPVGTARAELSFRRAGSAIEIVVDLEIAVARAVRARG